MALAGIEITNFRRIQNAVLKLDRDTTLLWGENAAGKTSVLEAIHFLSAGRSFRSPQVGSVLRSGQPFLRLIGVTEHSSRIALQASPQERTLRVDGGDASLSDVAALLPVCVIDPTMHKLIEEGPSRRRRLMDWGTFHVEPSFLPSWRRYARALQNRNAALRMGQAERLVRVWDGELAESGTELAECRARYLRELRPWLDRYLCELLPLPLTFTYDAGFDVEAGLAATLAASWPRDSARRMTSCGPQRADLQIELEGTAAKDRISRGQQKLLATAMVLAQLHHYAGARESQRPTLLLDDPGAELDVDNLQRLLRTIQQIPAQTVVTSLHESDLQSLSFGSRFHVKQGVIVQML